MRHKLLQSQRNDDVLEVVLRQDYKIIDRLEFRLNNKKDKLELLKYIKQKLGITFSKEEYDNIESW